MKTPLVLSREDELIIAYHLKHSKSKAEYRRALCLWLRVAFDMGAEQIARAAGVSVPMVWKVHADYLKNGAKALKPIKKGGRMRQNIKLEEEKAVLSRMIEQDGDVIVGNVKNEYEVKVGHKVAPSTVYRMLARHGLKRRV